MSRLFMGLMVVNLVLLSIPSVWMGWQLEFQLALILGTVTAAFWYRLRCDDEDR